MSDPRTAPRAEPPSERANALNVANSRDALEFAARVLQTRASMVPVGHEDRTKGPSTYNWLTYAVLLLRQAAASLPPGDAPQPCPHCKLPPTMPDVCTPELNAVIEEHIEKDWALLNKGVEIGQSLQPSPAAHQPCEWRDPGEDDVSWQTGCGKLWEFIDDGPSENGVKFCPYCGKPLVLVPAEEPTK